MTKEISAAINQMRFPLIVMVVIMHGMGFSYYIKDNTDVMFLSGYNNFDLYFFVKRCLYNFSTIAVPVFFIISGYLFFQGHFNKESYIKKIKKRFWTLFIPYFIWNTLLFLITTFKGDIHPSFIDAYWSNCKPYYEGINYLGFKYVPAADPINFPLWYVRDLMCLCLSSPIIYMLIRYLGGGILVFVFLLYVSYVWPHIEFNIESLFFFSLGAYLSIKRRSLKIDKIPFLYIVITLSVILGIVLSLSNGLLTPLGFYVRPYYAICGSVVFVNLFLRYNFSINEKLINSVFAIYVIHAVVIKAILIVLKKSNVELSMSQSLLALVLDCIIYPCMIILATLLIQNIMKILIPSMYRLAFGKR